MGRKRTVHRDFPPHLKLNGKTFYYDHGIVDGKRKYTALGQDHPIALRRWAELEGEQVPASAGTFGDAVKRYRREVLKTVDTKTQAEYTRQLLTLEKAFARLPLDKLTAEVAKEYFRRRSIKRTDQKGRVRGGPHAAARELALLSTVFNHARQWGYTNAANPRQGMRLPKAKRTAYVTDAQYKAIYEHADEILRDAMDLAYQTGQRPSDVLRMSRADIQDGHLLVTPRKTSKTSRAKIRVPIVGELELVLKRIQERPRKITSVRLLQFSNGDAVGLQALERRWSVARAAAGIPAELAQFRDIRAKTSTDLEDLEHAQKLLAHTSVQTTEGYRRGRRGDVVQPLNRKIN